MAAYVLPNPKQQYFTPAGVPLVGGKMYTYAVGTSTPKASYSDAAMVSPNANPVILDSRGEALIYWSGLYRVELRDSLDSLIYAVDNYGDTSSSVESIQAFIAALGNPANGSGADLVADADRSFATVAELRAFPKPLLAPGRTLVVSVQEYATGTGIGGGQFRWDATSAAADNSGTVINPTGNAGSGRWHRITDTTRVNLSWFGADPTGVTAADTPMANAISAIGPSGTVEVDIEGRYRFTQQIIKAPSFFCFSIIATRPRTTTFDYTAIPAGMPFILITGGSGALSDAEFTGIYWYGSGANRAFEIDGQNYVKIREPRFGAAAMSTVAPVLLHNNNPGNFTEFCTVEDFEYEVNCPIMLEYKKEAAGHESFHGSGLVRGLGHVGNSVGVIIGADCLVYNAPMDLGVFIFSGGTLIQNFSSRGTSLFGDIRVEGGGNSFSTIALLGQGFPIAFAGQVTALSVVNFGTLSQVRNMVFSGPIFGNLIQTRKDPSRKFFSAINSGNSVANVAGGSIFSSGLISIRFAATGYEYRYFGYAEHNGTGAAGIWVPLATGLTINTAGYGPPVITVNAVGDLIVTNGSWPANTISVQVETIYLGGTFNDYQ